MMILYHGYTILGTGQKSSPMYIGSVRYRMMSKFTRMLVSVAHRPFTLFHETVLGRPQMTYTDPTYIGESNVHLVGLVIPFLVTQSY